MSLALVAEDVPDITRGAAVGGGAASAMASSSDEATSSRMATSSPLPTLPMATLPNSSSASLIVSGVVGRGRRVGGGGRTDRQTDR
eukprot:scaffold46541_cov57-Phaeocystis_antarctica.AAC.5